MEDNQLTITKQKKLNEFQTICLYFLIYSLIGWIGEAILAVILLR